jgi:site-specific recombinase XerD
LAKTDINKNMLRERALKLPDVSEEMFQSCNPHNVDLINEYLETSNTLSPETLKQYKSALYQFVYYIKTALNDKEFYKITKRDFKRYMSYLVSRNMSSSGLKFKKSAVSSFCSKFIEIFLVEEIEEYKSFRNFTTGTIEIPKNQVYNKIAISKEEYDLMIETLLEDENYLGVAWVATMFNVGCRRSGCIQFKSEIVTYPFEKDKDGKELNYKLSHYVREKGASTTGKPCIYMFNEEALKYIQLWLDKRGYEHEFIFTIKYNNEIKVMSKSWGDSFCSDVLSDIVGRRINVHLFKASCVTYLLEQGKSLKSVSKYVAQHESIETTMIYDLRDDTEERNSLFD